MGSEGALVIFILLLGFEGIHSWLCYIASGVGRINMAGVIHWITKMMVV